MSCYQNEDDYCFSRNHKLSGHNGFIPLLCYGDILLTLQYIPAVEAASSPVLTSANKTVSSETVCSTDSSAVSSRPASGEKKHDFVRTHFQTSTQCKFCGKKVSMYEQTVDQLKFHFYLTSTGYTVYVQSPNMEPVEVK